MLSGTLCWRVLAAWSNCCNVRLPTIWFRGDKLVSPDIRCQAFVFQHYATMRSACSSALLKYLACLQFVASAGLERAACTSRNGPRSQTQGCHSSTLPGTAEHPLRCQYNLDLVCTQNANGMSKGLFCHILCILTSLCAGERRWRFQAGQNCSANEPARWMGNDCCWWAHSLTCAWNQYPASACCWWSFRHCYRFWRSDSHCKCHCWCQSGTTHHSKIMLCKCLIQRSSWAVASLLESDGQGVLQLFDAKQDVQSTTWRACQCSCS